MDARSQVHLVSCSSFIRRKSKRTTVCAFTCAIVLLLLFTWFSSSSLLEVVPNCATKNVQVLSDEKNPPSPRSTYQPLLESFVTLKMTKIADVTIENEPEAFFLAILPVNGTLFGSYRTSLTSWETNVIELGHDFKPLTTKIGAVEKKSIKKNTHPQNGRWARFCVR
mmetsp:Transcript_6520/g.19436  ORF Transcript_6520/g.19436 Transcript_6520/m.19436 type:complete len:167 (-) Transcript_6520:1040-1540(-)